MKTLRSYEALVRRNAEACETAKHKACDCHCGGALHGRKHDAGWVTRVAQGMYQLAQQSQAPADPGLFPLESAPAQPGEDS